MLLTHRAFAYDLVSISFFLFFYLYIYYYYYLPHFKCIITLKTKTKKGERIPYIILDFIILILKIELQQTIHLCKNNGIYYNYIIVNCTDQLISD